MAHELELERMTAAKGTHVTACCGPVPAGDASEHLVHRLLLALAAHPDGATVAQLQTDLGGVPPEALARRLHDLFLLALAEVIQVDDNDGQVWALTTAGQDRAADIKGAPWRSSRATPTAAPTAAPEPKPT